MELPGDGVAPADVRVQVVTAAPMDGGTDACDHQASASTSQRWLVAIACDRRAILSAS
jgi:hypothetical protein